MDGTVMLFARLDGRTVYVVRTMNIKVERGGVRQTLFSTLCVRYLRPAVAGILEMAWKARA